MAALGPKQHLQAVDRRAKKASKPLAQAIYKWMQKCAIEMSRRAATNLNSGMFKFAKASPDKELEDELLELLNSFGVKHMNATGKEIVASSKTRREWILEPSVIQEIIDANIIKVKGIMNQTRQAVRQSINRILSEAANEVPKPTMTQLARRISMTFHGTGGIVGDMQPKEISGQGILPTTLIRDKQNQLYAFSPQRAMLIARTESAKIENQAIAEGMKASGVEYVRWLAYGNDGTSQPRDHYEMNNLSKHPPVPIGEYFRTPLGNQMRWPGDGPAEEICNCRCTLIRASNSEVKQYVKA